ncbi:hypothetical protein [Halobacillus sp. Marseille-Q1614]|uniref:hypothetical protein n=1 Tax=Halobacillus sp. Marseille-Q1614 TaxID=2709134 RepID=UPI00156D9B68|nr:hypothetical protein [Halobacillus sp. Marseille-Q1614]
MKWKVIFKIIYVPVMAYVIYSILDLYITFDPEAKIPILISVTLTGYWQVFFMKKKEEH